MSWALGALAAQDAYDPDAGDYQAELWRAERPYRGTQGFNVDRSSGMGPVARATPGVAGAVMGALADIAKVPGQQMAANPYPSGSEEASWYEDQRARNATNWGPEMAMNLAGTGTAFATKGAAGMFGGRLGANPKQLQALETARDMENAGRSKLDIWTQTGWDKFKDGHWRFELPGGSGGALKKGEGRLADLWDYPALWKAYPDIAEMAASHGVRRPSDFPFQVHKDTRAMYINKQENNPEMLFLMKGIDNPKRSLQHEVTHGIQAREGFARGANPLEQEVLNIAREERDARILASRELFTDLTAKRDKFIRESGVDFSQLSGFERHAALKQLEKRWLDENIGDEMRRQKAYTVGYLQGTPPIDMQQKYDVYRRFLGEVEARVAPERAKLSLSDKRSSSPSYHLDLETPYDQQIVRYGKPVAASMGDLLGVGR